MLSGETRARWSEETWQCLLACARELALVVRCVVHRDEVANGRGGGRGGSFGRSSAKRSVDAGRSERLLFTQFHVTVDAGDFTYVKL